VGTIIRFVVFALVVGACASAENRGDDTGDPVDAAESDGDLPPDACIPTPGGETCNGADDDCNGSTDEGFPGVGEPCQVGVGACIVDGTTVCTSDGSTVECDAVPLPPGPAELCGNAIDDDCDDMMDEGFVLGATCTSGVGVCQRTGTTECNDEGTGTQCNAVPGTGSTETCNALDDDCDGPTDEGFMVGSACDGGDGDLCTEGVIACSGGGGTTCSDATGTTVDLCGGGDDDCDPASADGSEDPQVGVSCDGGDSDLCLEGTRQCSGGMLSCNDATGSTLDVCNGSNDDCDPASADGSEDAQVGMPCDGTDTDLCVEGIRSCSGGGLICSDNTSSTVELCGTGDDDCDGMTDEGFPRDDNPVCPTFNLGSVSGDTGTGVLSDSWYDEEFDTFILTEDSTSSIYLSATISLTSAAGTDFDLFVYCVACGGTLAGSSTLGGLTGHTDTVQVRTNDDLGPDDDKQIVIEVRHWASNVCAPWSLTVNGNTAVTTENCPD
jgi:hypothetical protein